jgi:hypothetical protein
LKAIANTDLIVTETDTYVILPKDYVVLWMFSNYKGGGRAELPSLEASLIFIIIFGGIGYMIKQRIGYSVLYLTYSTGLYYFSWLLLSISLIASIILVVRKHISEKSVKWMLAGAALLIVLCLVVVALFGMIGLFSMGGAAPSKAVYVEADYDKVQEAETPVAPAMAKSLSILGRGEGAITVPTREGVLPVRLELPALGKTIMVKSHLVHMEEPLKVSVLVVAAWFKYVLYLISLAAGIQCIREYSK